MKLLPEESREWFEDYKLRRTKQNLTLLEARRFALIVSALEDLNRKTALPSRASG